MKQLLNIKKEKDGLGKQVNKLTNKILLKTYLLSIFTLLLFVNIQAQDITQNGEKYVIGGISVLGNTSFSEQTIVTYSGLKKGEEVIIPGDKISDAIKKLWNSNLFNNIEIHINRIEGNLVFLEIRLEDLPEINEVKINGVKKNKKEKIIEENTLEKGVKVTENLLTTTKNYLETKYKKEGFYNTKVTINAIEVKQVDTLLETSTSPMNLVVNIDKGKKVKVKEIVFNGTSVLPDSKLKKAMKNTKQKNITHVLKRSKYIEADYKADLKSLVDKYKENGFRDARVISDSVVVLDQKNIALYIDIEEGELYHFGKIDFIGNTVYSDETLRRILRINPGETYNGVLLEKRIADKENPEAMDIANIYQNNGYLFSTINTVEVSAEGNVIDLEIRISEGKPVYFNNVTVVGNDVTNDHVIYRELHTRPGQLYNKSNVIRTIRELSALGFFDPAQLTTDFPNPNPNEGTIDLQYTVVETGSSQIELQGGYGGGGFIGTLGLSFNNFSLKNILNPKEYTPVPRGDGQQLALRLQASQFYQTYSFSFSEPWLGGEKPVQFSTSVSHTKQFLYDSQTGKADRDKAFNITGISVGIAKRLNVPDNFFTLSQAVSYQHYNLKNYNTGLFTFGDGYSNNLAFTIGLSRNSTFTDPVFPVGGSKFNVSAKFTLPYSLFNGVDYNALKHEREDLEDITLDNNYTDTERREAAQGIAVIDQERFKWLEFYKIQFSAEWYQEVVKKLVLRPYVGFGFLGAYNQDRGDIPFERFFLGGDGLGSYSLDGREAIALRGYPNQSIQPVGPDGYVKNDGGTIYNKFSLELRYPITLKQQAKIYVLGFMEGGASFNNFNDYSPFDLKRSAGAGLRVFMPAFGLLGIDFAYGFDPVPGQTQPNGWETHFIIGQQF
jgi:outer membrane protein insertion porin family